MTLYDRLGVPNDATADEIRAAYRRKARQMHPDAAGAGSAGPGDAGRAMAELNDAWRVLGDPARRAMYDAGLRRSDAEVQPPDLASSEPGSAAGAWSPPTPAVAPRFPWRGMLFFGSLAVVAVLVASLLAGEPDEKPPDNLLGPGSCVTIEPNGDAREAPCREPHDGTVDEVVPFGATCTYPAEPHRDHQGLGLACVLLDG